MNNSGIRRYLSTAHINLSGCEDKQADVENVSLAFMDISDVGARVYSDSSMSSSNENMLITSSDDGCSTSSENGSSLADEVALRDESDECDGLPENSNRKNETLLKSPLEPPCNFTLYDSDYANDNTTFTQCCAEDETLLKLIPPTSILQNSNVTGALSDAINEKPDNRTLVYNRTDSTTRPTAASHDVDKTETESEPDFLCDFAHCPIHMGLKRSPKLLSCEHSFCETCLEKQQSNREVRVSDSGTKQLQIKCSICREYTQCESVSALKTDERAKEQVQKLRSKEAPKCEYCFQGYADYFCPDCSIFLCDLKGGECIIKHSKIFQAHRGDNSHKIVDYGASSCPEHGKYMKFLCLGCATPLCPLCVRHSHHKNEKCDKLGTLIEICDKDSILHAKEQVQAKVKDLLELANKAKCLHKAINEVYLKELFQSTADIEAELDTVEQSIIRIIRSIRKEFQNHVDDQKHTHSKQRQDVLNDLREMIGTAEATMSHINTNDQGSFATLAIYRQLLSDLENIKLPQYNGLSAMRHVRVLKLVPGRISDWACSIRKAFGQLKKIEWLITPNADVLKNEEDIKGFISRTRSRSSERISDEERRGRSRSFEGQPLCAIFKDDVTDALKCDQVEEFGASKGRVVWRSYGGTTYKAKELFDVTTLADGTLAGLDSAKGRLVFYDQDCTKFRTVRLEDSGPYALGSLAAIGSEAPLLITTDTSSACLRLYDVNGSCVNTFGKGIVRRPLCSAVVPRTNHIMVMDKIWKALLIFDIETSQHLSTLILPESPRMKMDYYSFCCGNESRIYISGKSIYKRDGYLTALLNQNDTKLDVLKSLNLKRPSGLDMDQDNGHLYVCSDNTVVKYETRNDELNVADLPFKTRFTLTRGVSHLATGSSQSVDSRYIAVVGNSLSSSYTEVIAM